MLERRRAPRPPLPTASLKKWRICGSPGYATAAPFWKMKNWPRSCAWPYPNAVKRARRAAGAVEAKGTPAEVALRLLALKPMFNWSVDELQREVRANLVYREFTRIGGGKVPDDKTTGRLPRQLGLRRWSSSIGGR